MKVELVDYNNLGELGIAQSAGICYGKDNKDINRVGRLRKHKHLSTFRFAWAVFKISGISVACQNQLVRHKHLDYLVESKRYVDVADKNKLILPPNLSTGYKKKMQKLYNDAISLYKEMISNGIAKEDARFIIPCGIDTTMYIAGNLQAWIDFINLRTTKSAQWEIREVALEIKRLLRLRYPHCIEFE